MSILFDQSIAINDIFRCTSTVVTAITNNAGVSVFDYFTNTASVGDWIAFGLDTGVWHNLVLNVGTAVAATGYTYIWEYSKAPYWPCGWATLTCTDNTSGFTVTGTNTVSFSVPDSWSVARLVAFNNYGSTACYIRCRITGLTAISEGGANATAVPTCNDYAITVSGTTIHVPADLLTSAASAQVTNIGDTYYINANIKLGGVSTTGKFTIENSTVQVGTATKLRTIVMKGASSVFTIGRKTAGTPIRYSHGGMLKYYNQDAISLGAANNITVTTMDYAYNSWNGTFNMYNSTFWKRSGGFYDPLLSTSSEYINSTFSSIDYTQFYFNNTTTLSFTNTTVAMGPHGKFYIYTGSTIDNLILADIERLVIGATCTVSNISFASGHAIQLANSGTSASFKNCSYVGSFLSYIIEAGVNNTGREVYGLVINMYNTKGQSISGYTNITNVEGTVLLNGAITGEVLIETSRYYKNASSVVTTTIYNPITIRVCSPGYKPYITTITLNNTNKYLNITLEPLLEMQKL